MTDDKNGDKINDHERRLNLIENDLKWAKTLVLGLIGLIGFLLTTSVDIAGLAQ